MKCDYCGQSLKNAPCIAQYDGEQCFTCNQGCKEKLEAASAVSRQNLKKLVIFLMIDIACIVLFGIISQNAKHIGSFAMLTVSLIGIWVAVFPAPKLRHVRVFGYKKALRYTQLVSIAIAAIFISLSIFTYFQ